MRDTLTMDLDEAHDIADEIEFGLHGEAKIREYRRMLDGLQRGETGRAVFLGHLGEHLAQAGRTAEARAVFHEQIADGGDDTLDARLGLFTLEVIEDPEAADALLAELLAAARAGELGVGDREWIGESLEEAGRLREAARWYTMVLRDVDPSDVEALPVSALEARYRVRRALDLPRDRYDDARDLTRELRGAP